ncbi:MAG: hypothetical protein ABIO60_04865 [Aquaticitalea sp.]
MSLNQIVTPLDSAVLDSKEQYGFYHKMIDFVLKELLVNLQQNALCTQQELFFFKQYSDLLLYSIEAMRIKYMYDDEDSMKVDLTESGFPNYLEFRYLFNDLSLRESYVNKLKDISVLQEEFLDQLLRKKELIPRDKLFQAASIVYYTSVDKHYIYNRFVQGKIIDAPAGSQGKYMTSWSFFDVALNRPFICYMYFDFDGRDIAEAKENIYEILKTVADREMSMDTMAYAIDRKLVDVHPKHIKRIDLGPAHNVFAKDENEVTHTILKSIAQKEIPLESFAISMQIDEVFSGSEFSEGSYFSKQTLQNWSRSLEQKYIFAPHRIIQLLYSKTPEIINGLAKPPIQIGSLQ